MWILGAIISLNVRVVDISSKLENDQVITMPDYDCVLSTILAITWKK